MKFIRSAATRESNLILATVALLFFAIPLQAQSQAVRISSEVSNSRPVNGETVQVTVTVNNQLQQVITNVQVNVRVENGLITATSTPTCGPQFSDMIRCGISSIAPGQSGTFRLDLRVSNSAATASVMSSVSSYSFNGPPPPPLPPPVSTPPPPSDPISSLNLILVRPQDEADLKLRLSESPSPIPNGTPVEAQITVTNAGPATARDVIVLEGRIGAQTQLDPRCIALSFSSLLVCRASALLPGESTTFRNVISAFATPTQIERRASVTADRLYDPDGADNSVVRLVAVGIPAVLTRVLLPIVTSSTPGALGSQWRTDFSLFVDGDVRTFFFPLSFPCRITCLIPSLTGEFAPLRETWQPSLRSGGPNPGLLLRFDAARAAEVSFALRVRDLSRDAEDFGTELPVVRDSDLFATRIHLLDVPFNTRFRQTLRIYDPDASGSSRVRVRVYGLSPVKDLLLDEVVTLSTFERLEPTQNLGLPALPGFVQYDLGSKIPRLSDYRTGRVEIEPVTSGLRFWAFLSVTNNTTQRVTLITPQRAAAGLSE